MSFPVLTTFYYVGQAVMHRPRLHKLCAHQESLNDLALIHLFHKLSLPSE